MLHTFVIYINVFVYLNTLPGWAMGEIINPDVPSLNIENKNQSGIIMDINTNLITSNYILEEKWYPRKNYTYPGTKWCGPGDIADNYDDLGLDRPVDMCCRAHDHCPEQILGGEKMNNLTNHWPYTRVSCECDEAFRTCLLKAKSFIALLVGSFYFDFMNTKCFRKDYPGISCLRRARTLVNKCLEYSYDRNSEEVYGWFDTPNFYYVGNK